MMLQAVTELLHHQRQQHAPDQANGAVVAAAAATTFKQQEQQEQQQQHALPLHAYAIDATAAAAATPPCSLPVNSNATKLSHQPAVALHCCHATLQLAKL
jgi:hypothetical protein